MKSNVEGSSSTNTEAGLFPGTCFLDHFYELAQNRETAGEFSRKKFKSTDVFHEGKQMKLKLNFKYISRAS